MGILLTIYPPESLPIKRFLFFDCNEFIYEWNLVILKNYKNMIIKYVFLSVFFPGMVKQWLTCTFLDN